MIFEKTCRSPEVAHDRKLEAAGYTVSVNGGNDWLRQLHFCRSLITAVRENSEKIHLNYTVSTYVTTMQCWGTVRFWYGFGSAPLTNKAVSGSDSLLQ